MQHLIIVYNPRSSKHAKIEKEVLKPAQKLGGYAVGKFEIKQVPVNENAKNLAKILEDGDLILVAGGDGSAAVGVNACMLAKTAEKNTTLAVLGYGNFNDTARTLGTKNLSQVIMDFESGNTQTLFPLEARVDGEFFRFAACYFSVGLFAESTEVFNAPETREKLKRGNKGLVFSIKTLASWYFKNHKKDFLAKDIQLNDIPMNHKKVKKSGRVNEFSGNFATDVLFVNGKTVAKIMKGGDFWLSPDEFRLSVGRFKKLKNLIAFMTKAILHKIPGRKVNKEAKIDFSAPEEFEIQAEGEYQKIRAKELIVKKAATGITVVV